MILFCIAKVQIIFDKSNYQQVFNINFYVKILYKMNKE